MLPAYNNVSSGSTEPLDILFINLTNWPGNPVYPYAFVQVSALARRAGLSVRRWDGLGLNRGQQLNCISDLVRQYQPRAVGFTIQQADSTESDEYLGTKAESRPRWFPMEDTQSVSRKAIWKTAKHFGLPLISCNKGYFIAETDDEITEYKSSIQNRIDGMEETRKRAIKNYKEWKK